MAATTTCRFPSSRCIVYMPRTASVSSHPNASPYLLQLLRRPSSAEEGGRSDVPTLQRLCERTVARHMVEPRSALALLEFADAAGAQLLRQHSLAVSCLLPCRHFSTPALVCSSTGQGRIPKGGWGATLGP